MAAFEAGGDEAVKEFAYKKIVPMLYNEGQECDVIKAQDYLKWKKTQVFIVDYNFV